MQCHLGKHQWEDTGPRGAGSEKGLDGVSFPVERTKKERTKPKHILYDLSMKIILEFIPLLPSVLTQSQKE